MNSKLMGRFLGSTIIAGLAFTASAPTFAQNTYINGEEATDVEEITVILTGSRLNVNPNLEGAAPVLGLSGDQIASRGTTRIEDLTNQLPQVFAGQAGEVSNGASGTATLNLRGLGAKRTLVLIDGRRLPYGSSQIAAANLDLIPTQFIERVDVLTGGASAVYGSDALGGVANFILKRDFEGLELDFQSGFQQNGNSIGFFEDVLAAGGRAIPGSAVDGEEYSIAGIVGINSADDRGNVTIFANYERRRPVIQADRIFSACTLGADDDPVTSFGGAGCVGSANFRLFGGNNSTVLDAEGETTYLAFQEESGNIIEFKSGPATTFNFGRRNFFQRPSERFTIYGKANYELADNLEFFADISYVDNISDAQIAETASFGVGAYSINCDNPLIQGNLGIPFTGLFGCSAQDIIDGRIVDGITASHRNVEGGPRNSRLENSTFRIVFGLLGDFADGVWSYEVFGQYTETSDTSISTNDFIVAKLQQAFLAVDDGNGNVVCIDPSGGCVPYNPFQRGPNGETLITSDQTDFLHGVGAVVGETRQKVVGANLQGNLGAYGIASPFAADGVGFLVGAEYRDDSLNSIPDEISQVPGGGFTGVGGATLPVAGAANVFELYTELQMPIAQDHPFLHELTLAGQYRYSDYTTEGNSVSNSFTTDTFGAQLTWAPVKDITFRSQFQRAVRAPNVIELFTGQDTGLPNLNSAGTNAIGEQLYDPCASSAPIATFEQCANTGVTVEQFGNIIDVISGQTQSLTGGNPDLDPESSDTWTVGVVLTPSGVPSLSISLDLFDITVKDFISEGIEAQTTLTECLNTGNPAFCNLISRAPSGTLSAGIFGVGFLRTNINIAEVHTSGLDVQVLYSADIGNLNTLRFDYVATYLDTADFIPFPGGDPIGCAGFLNNGCIQPVNPDYRHRLITTWESNFGLNASVTWRYFSSVSSASGGDANITSQIDDNLPSVNYVDLSFVHDLTDSITLRGGVLNVLNEQPPVSASSGPPLGNGNTFPTIYDTGRSFFGGVNFKF